jgi:hypothetical protein
MYRIILFILSVCGRAFALSPIRYATGSRSMSEYG